MNRRWKVGCINWSHPSAPHAMACLIDANGLLLYGEYFATHAEAIAYADKQARRTA